MLYQEILPRSKTKPQFQKDRPSTLQGLSFFLRISLSNTTWLALGATLQACLLLLPLPKHYIVLPGILYLICRAILTALVTFNVLPNPYLRGVIPYRYTAIVPDEAGNFPAEHEIPTKEKITILLLCARINHPAGWFGAPHVERMGDLFDKMNEDFRTMPQQESGILGHSQAFMPSPDGAIEVMNISYWRSKEHVLQYANSPVHREAMKWWTDLGGYDGKNGKISHIGIAHEIYESAPGQWESVYLGCQPTLLGATSYRKTANGMEKAEIPEEWISPIVAARRGKLAGSRGRMGLSVQATQEAGVEM